MVISTTTTTDDKVAHPYYSIPCTRAPERRSFPTAKVLVLLGALALLIASVYFTMRTTPYGIPRHHSNPADLTVLDAHPLPARAGWALPVSATEMVLAAA